MATLMLVTRRPSVHVETLSTAPTLRSWLREGWAVLFSHPDDFAHNDLEMDRWLVLVRQAFADSGIRLLSLAPSSADGLSPAPFTDRSWVSQVTDDARTVLLEDPMRQHFGAIDLQACALRDDINQRGRRFVMILDTELRNRKTLNYSTRADLPSPLEILGWADALRRKPAHTTPDEGAFFPNARAPLFSRERQHKHHVPAIACAPVIQPRASWPMRRAG